VCVPALRRVSILLRTTVLSFNKEDILFCACSSVISSMTPFDLWFPRGPAVAGNQRVHGKG
jgi:hypothetical protein